MWKRMRKPQNKIKIEFEILFCPREGIGTFEPHRRPIQPKKRNTYLQNRQDPEIDTKKAVGENYHIGHLIAVRVPESRELWWVSGWSVTRTHPCSLLAVSVCLFEKSPLHYGKLAWAGRFLFHEMGNGAGLSSLGTYLPRVNVCVVRGIEYSPP